MTDICVKHGWVVVGPYDNVWSEKLFTTEYDARLYLKGYVKDPAAEGYSIVPGVAAAFTLGTAVDLNSMLSAMYSAPSKL